MRRVDLAWGGLALVGTFRCDARDRVRFALTVYKVGGADVRDVAKRRNWPFYLPSWLLTDE